MRCDCCDKNLSDYESTLRSKVHGDYLNTCLKCLQGLQIDFVGNQALKRKFEEDPTEEEEVDSDIQEYTDWITRSQYPDQD